MRKNKKLFNDKLEYNEILKETLWGYPSPAKDYEDEYVGPDMLVSPQKNTNKAKKTTTKLLKFNLKKTDKENRMCAVKKNPLNVNNFRMNVLAMKHTEKVRRIVAEKTLDAPGMIDDFYLNLLDWSEENIVAIALDQRAYLMDYSTKKISLITPKADNERITSISWMNYNRNTLAVGMDNGTIEIWDTNRELMIRKLIGHSQRVSSLAWNRNILTSGGLDSNILNHDIRD